MSAFEGRRILVVDDEPANRRLIKAILAPEGPTIVEASDGAEALERIATGSIDLVILDVLMPGLDGIAVCARIRELGNYLPVVLVTALADADSRVRGKAAGADDFLVKPVHEDELLVRVRNLLRLHAYHAEVIAQRKDAERRAARWRMVSEVATAVTECQDHRCFLDRLVSALAGNVPVDCAGVLDIEASELVLLATCSSRPGSGPCNPVRIGGPSSATAAMVEDLRARGSVRAQRGDGSALAPLLDMMGLEDGIAIPVEGAGVLHQIVMVARGRAFSPEEVADLQQLAPVLGVAVNNVRLHLRSEQLLRRRDELTQFIVHDFRNVLTVAGTNVDLAMGDDVSEPDRQAMLGDAQGAIHRLTALVSDMLFVGAAEEGKLRLDRKRTDLLRLAEEALRQTVPKYANRVRVKTDPLGVVAMVDANLTRRVFENLLGNAARFSPPSEVIEVTLSTAGDRAVVTIENQGPRIPDEVRARLFQKYSRNQAGGLGLYFCRLVVEAHQGTIRLGEPVRGTRFEISLPV